MKQPAKVDLQFLVYTVGVGLQQCSCLCCVHMLRVDVLVYIPSAHIHNSLWSLSAYFLDEVSRTLLTHIQEHVNAHRE